MINGNPTEPLKIHKSIRQRDPISPFLFTIIGEALSYIISQVKQLNLVRGIKVGKDNVELTHLQFADDTLLFIPQDGDVIMNYERLFECFGKISGL